MVVLAGFHRRCTVVLYSYTELLYRCVESVPTRFWRNIPVRKKIPNALDSSYTRKNPPRSGRPEVYILYLYYAGTDCAVAHTVQHRQYNSTLGAMSVQYLIVGVIALVQCTINSVRIDCTRICNFSTLLMHINELQECSNTPALYQYPSTLSASKFMISHHHAICDIHYAGDIALHERLKRHISMRRYLVLRSIVHISPCH